ncbi:MAG TPA: hypothetical protein VK668_16865 [Mucilaginibacter sp.]|nr:hypothetical protein [Mucilaginibacter sp.]
MNTCKKNFTYITLFLLLVFLSSGCQLFDSANKKLYTYCPGLKISVNGVSYAFNGRRDIYSLTYDQSSQKSVKTYFEKPENGFHEMKDGGFYDIEISDNHIIDRSDNILGKTVRNGKDSTDVIFNETTRKIIFIQYLK